MYSTFYKGWTIVWKLFCASKNILYTIYWMKEKFVIYFLDNPIERHIIHLVQSVFVYI